MNPYLAHRSETDVNTSRKQRIKVPKKHIEVKLHSNPATTIHGNYPGYYGYRTVAGVDDRITMFRKEWFEKKRVLDIGCNAGLVTLNIARLFDPAYIEGVDIDPALVRKARWNLNVQRSRAFGDDPEYFPIAAYKDLGFLPASYRYSNVHFRLGEFVHEPDPEEEDELFDTILALSITKWIHLNNGDGGIRYFFNRVHKCLKKGGLFILEPQPYETYKKRAGMTERMRDNYVEMEFFPKDFIRFLTNKVGFKLLETLEPTHPSKGFKRPIYILQKCKHQFKHEEHTTVAP